MRVGVIGTTISESARFRLKIDDENNLPPGIDITKTYTLSELRALSNPDKTQYMLKRDSTGTVYLGHEVRGRYVKTIKLEEVAA